MGMEARFTATWVAAVSRSKSLAAAEGIGANIVDEATLVELRELHDRAHEALSRVEHRVDVR